MCDCKLVLYERRNKMLRHMRWVLISYFVMLLCIPFDYTQPSFLSSYAEEITTSRTKVSTFLTLCCLIFIPYNNWKQVTNTHHRYKIMPYSYPPWVAGTHQVPIPTKITVDINILNRKAKVSTEYKILKSYSSSILKVPNTKYWNLIPHQYWNILK
jgi:hypothetical protein